MSIECNFGSMKNKHCKAIPCAFCGKVKFGWRALKNHLKVCSERDDDTSLDERGTGREKWLARKAAEKNRVKAEIKEEGQETEEPSRKKIIFALKSKSSENALNIDIKPFMKIKTEPESDIGSEYSEIKVNMKEEIKEEDVK